MGREGHDVSKASGCGSALLSQVAVSRAGEQVSGPPQGVSRELLSEAWSDPEHGAGDKRVVSQWTE